MGGAGGALRARCPGDASHSGAKAWVVAGGLCLGPCRPRTEGSLCIPLPPGG